VKCETYISHHYTHVREASEGAIEQWILTSPSFAR